MAMTLDEIVEMIRELPPELQQEVADFAEFLLHKRGKNGTATPTFAWMGALEDLREQYTSVELQHQAQEWRVKDALGEK